MLRSSSRPLCELYDLAMLDLDGVVYIGGAAVPGAAERIAQARAAGVRVAFVTNNASRTPRAVAEHLEELGVEAAAEDVVTSSQAAARLLADRLGEAGIVACLGAEGLHEALASAGLRPVAVDSDPAADAEAIVTGYAPDVPWSQVMRAAVRIKDGLSWVATNTDLTFPAAYGTAPGHGVQVRMLSDFSGVDPVVAGKPARPLLDETVRRVGGQRPLMVGDRLDTDIEGAHRADIDSLLVMTGVTGLEELVAAPPELRPTYLSRDLAGLLESHPAPERAPSGPEGGPDGGVAPWRCEGWTARVTAGRLVVEGSGEPGDWWRVVAAAAWEHSDESGTVADATGLSVPAR